MSEYRRETMAAGLDLDPAGQREPRSSMILKCELDDGFGRTFTCHLRNISRQGIAARGCPGLRVGQRLKVTLPGIGDMPAVVRWVDKDKFGLHLDTEIDPEQLSVSHGPEHKFQPMTMHRVVNDFRRPPVKTPPAARPRG